MAECHFEVDEETLDVLASDPSTVRRSFKKLIERLIQHVLLLNKNHHLFTQMEEDSSFVVPLYWKGLGDVIFNLISLVNQDINELFEGIKEHIKKKDRLKAFLSRLADNLFGRSSHYLLFFIAIVVRIFTKREEDPYCTIEKYAETVSEILEENKVKIMEMGGFESMNQLVKTILMNPELLYEFRGIKCGKASDYF